jgi:hypothetical protein
MFFVLRNIHIKQIPNVIKIYEELFWNICDFWEVESAQTGAHSHHKTPGHARQPRRMVVGSALFVSRLEPTSGARKLIFGKKIMLKSQRNRSYESPDI